MIYGMHPVMEAIQSEKSIDKIFIQKGLQSKSSSVLLNLIKEKNISYKLVPVEKLRKLTKENHQGVIAFISPISFHQLDELLQNLPGNKPFVFVLLDGITDTRNFGAIIRTAAAMEATGIIISENNSAPVNEDVVKASAGGIFKIPICKVKHLKDALFLLQSYEIKIFSATEKAHQVIYQADLKQSFGLIMGSEGKGIQKSLLNLSEKIKIPISKKMDSFNVSVACGIILYESVRQKQIG